jgi:hypothetical protein
MASRAQPQPQPRSPGGGRGLDGTLEDTAERLAEPLVLAAVGALGVALAAPLVPVALPVCGALCATLGRSWRVKVPAYAACALPAVGAAPWLAVASHGAAPSTTHALVAGYADPLLVAGRALFATWPAPDWRRAATALASLWPYAATLGPLLGAGAFVSCSLWFGGTARNESLRAVGADELRKHEGASEPQPVDGFAARGRLTALTALPKMGKTFAWFGLLKARQTGGWWFGRNVLQGKTLVLSEEDRGTFSAKVKAFGITSAGLVSVHAPETPDARFGPEAWPALVDEAARLARRERCDTLTVDTLTTWAPWAFRGPESMSLALRTLKAACVRHRLAGVVILHNRKQQSDLGAVVDMLGTIAGSAAYDVVAGFRREKQTGECTLAVDGRLFEWTCTAVLRDGRYEPVATPAADDETGAERGPAVPVHLRGTLARLRGAPAGGIEEGDLFGQEGGSKSALRLRLKALSGLGLAVSHGRGVRGDPRRWRATDAPAATPEPVPAATADPAYDRYLKSPVWARKRGAALTRAAGGCEACGQREPVEVHHLERPAVLGEEPLSSLRALCAPCHRLAHPRHL